MNRRFVWISAAVAAVATLAACGGGGGGGSSGSSSGSTSQYTLGGSISGLSVAGLVLADGTGNTVSPDSGSSTFSFKSGAAYLGSGAAYNVSVQANPSGLVCSVSKGQGTATANVNSVAVTCLTLAQKQAEVQAEYASVVSIDLADYGLASSATATVIQGTAQNLTVVNGQIRFITGSDSGSDQEVVLSASDSSQQVTIPVLVQSSRNTSIVQANELDAEEATAGLAVRKPELKITGLGPNNSLVPGNPLTFSLATTEVIDQKMSRASLYIPSTKTYVNLDAYWTSGTGGSIVVPAPGMGTLLNYYIPSGEAELIVTMNSANGVVGAGYRTKVFRPSATLSGKIVDASSGSAMTTLSGRLVSVRGQDNNVRMAVPVDASGVFSATNLPAGTYQVSLLDVQAPDFTSATVPIYAGSSSVNVQLAHTQLAASAASAQIKFAQGVVSGSKQLSSTVTQNGSIASRNARASIASVSGASTSGCVANTGTQGVETYTVTSRAKDATESCVLLETIPKGTKTLSVDVSVATAEYPSYTQTKGAYDDTWSYAFAGLPGSSLVGSGSVNDSHYNAGTIKKQNCIDVSALTANGDYQYSAVLKATNVGDNQFNTSVTVSLSTTCSALSVNKAEARSLNTSGYRVIKNGRENFVSIPVAGQSASFGFPLSVSFSPANATITKVRLGLLNGGSVQMVDTDVRSQATVANGVLTFKNLNLPSLASGIFSGKASLVVELTGTVNGSSVVTNPQYGTVKIAGSDSFTPLFMASAQATTASQYGVREDGDDSWATYETIQWLKGKSYRYDDISALHAARVNVAGACPNSTLVQLNIGDSILCHSDHSNGREVDLRYADGVGGFTDTYGGYNLSAALKAVLDAAQAEVISGATTTPNLAIAQQWILANRKMLEAESPNASVIYVGGGWMANALFNGFFPDGKTYITGVWGWKNVPANVHYRADSLNHWHISLK